MDINQLLQKIKDLEEENKRLKEHLKNILLQHEIKHSMKIIKRN